MAGRLFKNWETKISILHIESKTKFLKFRIWEDYSVPILMSDFKLNLKLILMLLRDKKECAQILSIEHILLDLPWGLSLNFRNLIEKYLL
jgi:hypothetical protein